MAEETYRADVVVIGGGLAGIVTSLELLDQGKSVVLLERAGEERLGGLASQSFGGVFFVGSPEQRRSGIRDTVDLALADWLRYGELGPEDVWPRKWAEAYVSRSLEAVRNWSCDRGVKYFFAVNWTERGYFVPGNSVPRFHIVWGTGKGLVDPLVERLRAKSGLTLKFQHHVTSLDTEGGTFVGCSGTRADGEEFEARGDAVVIAAGGIAGDLDRVRSYWPSDLGEPPEVLLNGSFPEADGRLLLAATGHGAQMTHLSKMWNYAAGVRHWKPQHEAHGLSLVPMKSPLWTDATGRRFEDPPLVGSYDTLKLIEVICRQEKKYSWNILNWSIGRREFAVSGAEFNPDVRDKKLIPFLTKLLTGNDDLIRQFAENCPDFVTASSVPELAEKMNALTGTEDIDPKFLEAEIARYDAMVSQPRNLQNDDQLRRIAHARQYRGDRLRTCKRAPILDPRGLPLIAIRLQIVTRKSLGGLQVDLSGRVLNAEGQPIPGLYAVGEACGFGGGGIHGKRALEGTFLGGCIFSGQVAAQAIASGRGADQ